MELKQLRYSDINSDHGPLLRLSRKRVLYFTMDSLRMLFKVTLDCCTGPVLGTGLQANGVDWSQWKKGKATSWDGLRARFRPQQGLIQAGPMREAASAGGAGHVAVDESCRPEFNFCFNIVTCS